MSRIISCMLPALLVTSCKIYYPTTRTVGKSDGIYEDVVSTHSDTVTVNEDVVFNDQPYYGDAIDLKDYDRSSQEKFTDEPHRNSNVKADDDHHVTIYNSGCTVYGDQWLYPGCIPHYYGYYYWQHPWYGYRSWNTWYDGVIWTQSPYYWDWRMRENVYYYTPSRAYTKNPRYDTDNAREYRTYSRSRMGGTPSYSKGYRTYSRRYATPERQQKNSRYRAEYKRSRYSPPQAASKRYRKRSAVRSASRRSTRPVRVYRR